MSPLTFALMKAFGVAKSKPLHPQSLNSGGDLPYRPKTC